MMRVTCGTNILVRAAIQPAGPARALLGIVTAAPHVLTVSDFILCTLDRHFRQPLVRAYCATYGIRVLTDVDLLVELRA